MWPELEICPSAIQQTLAVCRALPGEHDLSSGQTSPQREKIQGLEEDRCLNIKDREMSQVEQGYVPCFEKVREGRPELVWGMG